MNILIITTQLPYPLTSGGAQAQYNMIDELRYHHHITLLFTEDRNNRKSNMRLLQQLWPDVSIIAYPYILQAIYPQFLLPKVIRGIQTYLCPQSPRYLIDKAIRPVCIYYSHLLQWFIARIVRKHNIQIIQTEFYPSIGLVHYLPKGIKTIFIQHEIHYKKNERYFDSMQLSPKQLTAAQLARQYEIDCMNRYDTVVTLTDVDQQILLQDGVTSPIFVSPAGVKTELCDFHPFAQKISFVGSFQHIPNQEGITWLLQKVLPLVNEHLELNIIGFGWPQYPAINNISIKALGFVDSLSQATAGSIMLVPILSGSGMRMKILEAAAASIPFITTSIGVEGLNFKHNQSCLVADTPEEFAAAIHRLSCDEVLQSRLAASAHSIYLSQYTTQALAQLRNKVYIS